MKAGKTAKKGKGFRTGKILALGIATGLVMCGGMTAAAAESPMAFSGRVHHSALWGHHNGEAPKNICGSMCSFVDEDGDGYCDRNCRTHVHHGESGSHCENHMDGNGDGFCDVCSFALSFGSGAAEYPSVGTDLSGQQENGAGMETAPAQNSGTYYGNGDSNRGTGSGYCGGSSQGSGHHGSGHHGSRHH